MQSSKTGVDVYDIHINIIHMYIYIYISMFAEMCHRKLETLLKVFQMPYTTILYGQLGVETSVSNSQKNVVPKKL